MSIMWLTSFLNRLRSRPQFARSARRTRTKSRRTDWQSVLRLEALEDRCLLSFFAPVSYAADASPRAVITADFNGDGRLDLAVANAGSNDVSILLGNGDGTFQAAQNYASGGTPVSLAVGDFNSDGKLDLVTAN